ncbi:MAG TPA: NAD(P)/FAD-dependent oxidoreductase [Acidimicrobiales bacterium]
MPAVPAVTGRRRVVVVGAGFAGLAVVRGLAGVPVDVTLVDANNFHTFQALLYQVATAGLNPADVAFPVRGIFHGRTDVTVRRGRVVAVDWDAGVVVLDGGATLAFDHLVVASGATTNWMGVAGAERHAFPLYSLADAVRLRNHLLSRFEAADADPEAPEGCTTVVVIGAGPTGVELSGALVELRDSVLRKDFPALDLDEARVVLVEARDAVLPPFAARSQRHALATLEARGVEVRLAERVAEVAPDRVVLASGEAIPAATVVWAAGVRAGPLGEALGAPLGPGGRVVVEADLSLPGRPDAFVAGDLAAARDTAGDLLPQMAPVAIQAGEHVARQVAARVAGRPTEPFRYRDEGMMATIGRRAGVAQLPRGLQLTGTLGWLAWLRLHLLRVIGFRNRTSVLVNWAWNYLTYDRGPRLILEQPVEPRP